MEGDTSKETSLDTPIARYRTVSAAHPPDLAMKVMALLAEGWQLYGSPSSQGRAGYDALDARRWCTPVSCIQRTSGTSAAVLSP